MNQLNNRNVLTLNYVDRLEIEEILYYCFWFSSNQSIFVAVGEINLISVEQ